MPKPRATVKTVRRVRGGKQQETVVPPASPVVPPASPEETPVMVSEAETIPETPTPSRGRREVSNELFIQGLSEVRINLAEFQKRSRDNKNASDAREFRCMVTKLNRLEKDFGRLLKKKRSHKTPTNRRAGGITAPVPISKELADFFGLPADAKLSRTECTKKLSREYIKVHNLQNPEDGRKIIPDKKLAKLLRYKKAEHGELTYASLQTLIQIHFPQVVKA